MPFKILQTVERGKTFLSCVPSAWENDNILLWPRKGSKKLQKNEDSQPGDDWISTPCQLKRSAYTYEEAQLEMVRMQRESDTEDERLPKKRQRPIDNDMNELAAQCITNKENISPTAIFSEVEVEHEPVQNLEVCVSPHTTDRPAENPTFITSEASFMVQQQETESETLYLVSPNLPQKSDFEETVLKRFEKIENTQEIIMFQLSQVSTQIDAFLRQSQLQKLNSQIGFKIIDNIDELQNLNDELKSKESVDMLKDKLSLICGSGKGSGLNNCYALIEVMFTRRFLTECSWAGGSKNAESKKHCFKAHNRVINLFFEVIHLSDKMFTLLECESFFKNILRNSERRYAAKMLRASATKIRGKGKGIGKKSKTIIIQDTDAAIQPKPTDSLTVPAQAAVSSQSLASQRLS